IELRYSREPVCGAIGCSQLPRRARLPGERCLGRKFRRRDRRLADAGSRRRGKIKTVVGAPRFVAGANGQPIERRETPGVLQPQGVRSGLAEGIAGDCSGGAVDPVRGGVNGIDQLIKVVMRTEGYLMRAVQSLRPPVTLEV